MQQGTPLQPRWYSPKQTADQLGYGLSKVKTLIKSGELKSIKDGKYRRITSKWIDEYIAKRIGEANLDADDYGLAA